ncbi:hypothetical protein Tco_0111228 [Tanacetum coccineum]
MQWHCGLRSDIQQELAIHHPTNLHQTYGLAKLVEDKLSSGRTTSTNILRTTPFHLTTTSPVTTPLAILPNPPKQTTTLGRDRLFEILGSAVFDEQIFVTDDEVMVSDFVTYDGITNEGMVTDGGTYVGGADEEVILRRAVDKGKGIMLQEANPSRKRTSRPRLMGWSVDYLSKAGWSNKA